MKLINIPYYSKFKTKIPSFLLTNISIANNLMFKIDVLVDVFCEATVEIYRENYNLTNADICYEYDINHGEISLLLYRKYQIVEVVKDPECEITKVDALKKNTRSIIANEWANYINFKIEFDRKTINNIKNLFMQKCIQKRNSYVYDQMIEHKGKIILGHIELINNQFIKIKYKNIFGFFPRKNQIPNEQFEEGQNIELYVSDVVKDATYSFPLVFSRSDKKFMEAILVDEIPEIADGVIDIMCIEWMPSIKAKVGVKSNQSFIDPIGSCIGQRGDRISNVSQRLNNEKIDLFLWSDNNIELLHNLFNPIKILEWTESEDGEKYTILIDKEDMNYAIGKFGSNIKLISQVMQAQVTVTCASDDDDDDDEQQPT